MAMWILPAVRRPSALGRSADAPAVFARGRVERTCRQIVKAMGARAERTAFTTSTGTPLRPHFRRIVESFFIGYRAAADAWVQADLVAELSRVLPEHRGFAFEGAGMAVAAVDIGTGSGGRRFQQLVNLASDHIYLLHVGAGWAMAKFRRLEGRTFRRLHPVLRWLAIDGAGFHEGYFGRGRPRLRRGLSSAGMRAFDQGLGRSFWFTEDANLQRISASIERLEPARRGDLWSGVGLAAAYAGGADDDTIALLRDASGAFSLDLAQGVAFAAEAHMRACNEAPRHTEAACRLVCALNARDAASIARQTAVELHDEGTLHAYEVWRSRLRLQLASHVFAFPATAAATS